MKSLGIDTYIHSDDLVGTWAGFGKHLACEESRPIGGNIPAVLQEESLEMVHLFTNSLAGAQTLHIVRTFKVFKWRASVC